MNEGGQLFSHTAGPVATRLWEHHLAELEYDELLDYVAGDLVIVGPLTEDGDTTGLTLEYQRFLTDWMAEQGVLVVTAV